MLLGHEFADPRLLDQALTHRSAARTNNERLEFLGDSLINLIVAELIFESHPRASEGEMTRLRSSLVSGVALAELARTENIGDHLRLGQGELKSGGFRRDSILADTLEAVIAAIYLDAGWSRCRERVRRLFEARVTGAAIHVDKDAKTRLQELLQGQGASLPVYELVATDGADHCKEFEVSCTIESPAVVSSGRGPSRRAAEQVAAEKALQTIDALSQRHTAAIDD